MNRPEIRRGGNVLNTMVDVTCHEMTCDRVFNLVMQRKSAYVCFATAHMLVEATRKVEVRSAYKSAAIVNPDGAPIAWCLKLLGYSEARCVNGPTNTPILLREAERMGIAVGFYGGRADTLTRMRDNLRIAYPLLKIAYAYSPPFRDLSEAERCQDLDEINASDTRLLFVGLGSPKQEIWMYRNHTSLDCVCLGVGAVFEILSGEKMHPPEWVQRAGLTWLVRLWQEPRRLALRNLYSPVFVAMWCAQFGSHVCKRMMGLAPRNQSTTGGSAKS